MANKTLKTRIINKHDTQANWAKAVNFIPKAGEVIVYTDLHKIKVGDGTTKVSALPFIDSDTVTVDLDIWLEDDENYCDSGTLSELDRTDWDNAFSNNDKTIIFNANNVCYLYPVYVEDRSCLIYQSADIFGNSYTLQVDLASGNYHVVERVNSKQDKLVSGTNIKTINGQTLLGSGNISVQEQLVSGTNIKTVNGQTILGNGNIPVQEPLVSGTNIKTVNGNSLLGSGNIELSDNTVIIDLGTLSNDSGTLSSEILTQINNNLESKSITFTGIINGVSITTSTYLSLGNVLKLNISMGNMVFMVDINLADGNYTFSGATLLDSGETKTINNISLVGTGNIDVQEPLVSGTNIKTINGNSILGSGDLTISANSIFMLDSYMTSTDTISQDGYNALKNGIENNTINLVSYGGVKLPLFFSDSDGGKFIFSSTINSTLFADKPVAYTITVRKDLVVETNVFEISIPTKLSELTNDSGFTTNKGTITEIKMNGSSKGTSGVVDLGTVITAHQDISGKQDKLVSGTNIKTINNQSILGSGNIETGLPAKQYTISNLNFINFSEGQSVSISASDSAIIENARTNNASVIYNEVNLQYLPLLYVEVANDIQVLYSDLHGHCGIVSINTTTNTATVLSVFKTGKNSTINLDTISNTKTNYDNVFNYLTEQGFARAYFNVEGFLDQENGIGNEQYYEAYLSGENKYFASCGKIYQYIVDTSTQGFHVELINGIKTINEQSLVGSGNVPVQEPLVSGTNIKTINGTSLLGSGNISSVGSISQDNSDGHKLIVTSNGTPSTIIIPDNDTHYATKLVVTNSTGTANASTTNGNTKLRLFDDNTARNTIGITGTGGTTVSSDASGNITINSTSGGGGSTVTVDTVPMDTYLGELNFLRFTIN